MSQHGEDFTDMTQSSAILTYVIHLEDFLNTIF